MNEGNPAQGITRRTVQGSAWMYGRMMVTNVINLGVMAILARQLTPADFGLVALAQVLLRFLAVIGASGVGEYIIYDNAEGREARTQAAFWLGMAMAMVVVVLGLLSMPVLTRFYTDDGLGTLLVLLIIRYPLDQLSTVPDALIKKSLDYKKLVIRDTVLEILTSLASVVMALTGFGVLSLVIPSLVASPLRAGIVMWMSKWHPSLPIRINLWKGIFKYSANVIGGTLASSIIAEGDTLIIGKTLGSSPLGLYNLSWQSANLVPRTITGVIGKLAMPAFSAISNDVKRLESGYRRVVRLLGSVGFPLIIGLFCISDKFILTIYGPQWINSILPFQILLISALSRSIGSPLSVIPNALGKPEVYTKISLGFIPIYLLLIVFGSNYGIIGVAIGVSLSRFLYDLSMIYATTKLTKLSLITVFRELIKPLVSTLLMGFSLWLIRIGMKALIFNNVIELIILVFCGGILYFIFSRMVAKDNLVEVITLFSNISPRFANVLIKIVM